MKAFKDTVKLQFLVLLSLGTLGNLACSNSAPSGGLASGQNSPTVAKKSEASEGEENELAGADLPQEIAGGFLTCAYVTTTESGFQESADKNPVGCVLKKNGRKIEDPNFDFKIGLYTAEKESEAMASRKAPAKSKWHAYGHLPWAGKQNHYLGMSITDQRSRTDYGPVWFPIEKLDYDSPQAVLGLVGKIPSTNNYDINNLSGQDGDFPILPAAACSEDGKIRPNYDTSRYTDPKVTIGQPISEILREPLDKLLKGQRIAPSPNMLDGQRPASIECFIYAKEADKSDSLTIVRTQPVIEGNGC